MSDYEEASPEQKLAIARFFTLSSPPGQVDEVLADVAKLVGDESVLTNDAILAMLRQYNTDSFTQIDCGDSKMLTTEFGKAGDDEFVDPSTGQVMVVDHRLRKATAGSSKQELSGAIASKRAAIEKECKSYLENNYKAGKATCAVYGADDGKITVCISALNKKLSNFWSGGWRSKFIIDATTAGTNDMTAYAKIHIHYFEDGNVQLNAVKEKSVGVNVTSDDAATAKNIIGEISKWESDWQSNLEEMYVEMHTKTFKAMRRFLPKTRKPMDWNPHFHSLASEINK